MSVYRLDPIDPEHASWRFSTEQGRVWAGAETPTEARELVARKTQPPAADATERSGSTRSPWLDATVTSCVQEPSMTHIHRGMVARADGSRVGG
jgi:hypothetical protein